MITIACRQVLRQLAICMNLFYQSWAWNHVSFTRKVTFGSVTNGRKWRGSSMDEWRVSQSVMTRLGNEAWAGLLRRGHSPHVYIISEESESKLESTWLQHLQQCFCNLPDMKFFNHIHSIIPLLWNAENSVLIYSVGCPQGPQSELVTI